MRSGQANTASLLEHDILDFDRGRGIKVEDVRSTHVLVCVPRPNPLSWPLMRVKRPDSSFPDNRMKRHEIWVISSWRVKSQIPSGVASSPPSSFSTSLSIGTQSCHTDTAARMHMLLTSVRQYGLPCHNLGLLVFPRS